MKSGENPRMTLSRMSPAYALFNRRPNPPQPPDALAADPPASHEGTEDTAECPLPAPAAAASEPIVNRPPQKAAPADSQCVPIAQSSLQSDPSAAVRRAHILCLADVQHRPVEWLWQERLASGTLAMLSADVGAGKTWIALALAAALSRGRAPFSGEPIAHLNLLGGREKTKFEHLR
jgi:AAA domain